MNIDPLAEASRRFSPYVYANNSPLYFTDPDGMQSRNHKTGIEAEEFFGQGDDDGRDAHSGGGPIDPPKPGEGTITGSMESSPGVPEKPTELNEVVINVDKRSAISKLGDSIDKKLGELNSSLTIKGDAGEYGPYIPDGYAVSVSGSVSALGYSYNGALSGVIDNGNNTALFGTYGPGYNNSLLPAASVSISFDALGNFGGEKDVLRGYQGGFNNYSVSAGDINVGYSTSSENGEELSSGTRAVSIGTTMGSWGASPSLNASNTKTVPLWSTRDITIRN